MSPWEGLNRRKFPRASYPCMITICKDSQEKASILTHTENIGVGGSCIILKMGLKMFSPVDVEIDLLDMDDHIKGKGKIVWSVRRRSDATANPLSYDTGIEFVDFVEKDIKRIGELIKKIANKDGRASLN
jgi:hypothetical protein